MSAVEFTPEFTAPVITWNTKTVQRALVCACEAFDEDVRAVTSGSLRPGPVAARHTAWWLLREHVQPQPSLPDLARALGRKDHTAVLHALRMVEHRVATRPRYAERVASAESFFLRDAIVLSRTGGRIAVREVKS